MAKREAGPSGDQPGAKKGCEDFTDVFERWIETVGIHNKKVNENRSKAKIVAVDLTFREALF